MKCAKNMETRVMIEITLMPVVRFDLWNKFANDPTKAFFKASKLCLFNLFQCWLKLLPAVTYVTLLTCIVYSFVPRQFNELSHCNISENGWTIKRLASRFLLSGHTQRYSA